MLFYMLVAAVVLLLVIAYQLHEIKYGLAGALTGLGVELAIIRNILLVANNLMPERAEDLERAILAMVDTIIADTARQSR
jgi:hypothetical protein